MAEISKIEILTSCPFVIAFEFLRGKKEANHKVSLRKSQSNILKKLKTFVLLCENLCVTSW